MRIGLPVVLSRGIKLGCFKNLFKRRPRIIKTVSVDPLQLSEEMRKELAEDQKKIFPHPIRDGSTRRGRRAYGRIISYPPTRKHREGLSWLLDDKEK